MRSLITASLAVSLLMLPGCGEAASRAEEADTASPPSTFEGPLPEATGETERPDPPGARRDLLEDLRADRDAPRHASDGGGRAWLVDPEPIAAGEYGRWTIVYEVGPMGIAAEGGVYLQVSPFWRWSTPWIDPDARYADDVRRGKPGRTDISWEAADATLDPIAYGNGLVFVRVAQGRLAPGDRITFVYGAGEVGARADDYAEAGSVFVVAVDGDGDGVRKPIDASPRIDVAPGAPAQIAAHVPSVLEPGGEGWLQLAVLDGLGSGPVPWTGELSLSGLPEAADLPSRVTLSEADGGVLRVPFRCPTEGTWRVVVEELPAAASPGEEAHEGEVRGGLFALSNPVVVQAGSEPILWADLHGHSQVSDGTGTPRDYHAYARDVAALDVVALTDHDHWGFAPLAQSPETWAAIQGQVQAFHEPDRMITLLGFESTNWIHGHRHVLSFEEQPSLEVLDSVDERYETPRQLWDALRGRDVLTFAHHSAGGPIPIDWSYPPDPVLEPVTEIVSVHGSSEADDSPMVVYRPQYGNFVRDVLTSGIQLGFVGSGDSHDGHPGLAHLANTSGSGGLAAILTSDRSRAGVLAALRERRCYATSGPRIVVRATLAGARMGARLDPPGDSAELVALVRGTAPVEWIDVIRSGQVIDRQEVGGESFDVLSTWSLDDLAPDEYVYLRVVQSDGHVAWTSPFFIARG